MNRAARFWDRYAEKYARKPVADEAAYRKKLEITRGYFRPDMEVLEIGCGTGSTAIEHAPHVGHITATDISAGMIGIARRKAADAGIENVSFETMDVSDLDYPRQSFDAVMAHSILHLLADWEAAIVGVYRMLRPGGAFISSTGCIGDMSRILRLLLPLGRFLRLIPFVCIFTRDELVQSLADAGFRIDQEWQPKKGAAVFIIATKPAGANPHDARE